MGKWVQKKQLERVSAEDGESIRRHWRNAANPKGMLKILCDLYPKYKKETILAAINHDPFREVEKQYQQIKEKQTMAKRKTWDKATIDAAVSAVLIDGERTGEVGERFGVPSSTLGRWLTDARNKQKEFMDYADETEKELACNKTVVEGDIPVEEKAVSLPRSVIVTDFSLERTKGTAVDEKYIKAAAYDVITTQMAVHPDSGTEEMMCFIQGVQALAKLLCSEVE